MNTQQQTDAIIRLAQKHVATAIQPESAKFLLADAHKLLALGDHISAANAAVKSLKYSVGIFHPDYEATKALLQFIKKDEKLSAGKKSDFKHYLGN